MARNPSVGGFTGGGSRGAASGVDYFSNLLSQFTSPSTPTPPANMAPAAPTIQDEAATPGAGVQPVTPEAFAGPAGRSTNPNPVEAGLDTSTIGGPPGVQTGAAAPGAPSAPISGNISLGDMATGAKAAGAGLGILGVTNHDKALAQLGSTVSMGGKALGAANSVNDVMNNGLNVNNALAIAGLVNPTIGILGGINTAIDKATGFNIADQVVGHVLNATDSLFGNKPNENVEVSDVNAGLQPSGVVTSPVSMPGPTEATPLGPVSENNGGGVGSNADSDGSAGSVNPGGGGISGFGGGTYADGGMITSGRPAGLTPQYLADGGEIQGPLLAMGFANGGMMPPPGGVGMSMPGSDMSPQMIEMRVSQMIANPQIKQKLIQGVQRYMQSGQLTPQEVQTMGQVAEATLQNPDLYPRLRQFVAQQGMTPLPPSYDPSVIMKILAISRAVGGMAPGGMPAPGMAPGGMPAPGMAPGGQQATPAGQIPPTSQAQMHNPTGAPDGGFLQGPGTGTSDSIGTVNMASGGPVKVSSGEYVIPAHVVAAKGKDFFDNLLRKYARV